MYFDVTWHKLLDRLNKEDEGDSGVGYQTETNKKT
jgi:hypothetical protein